MSPDSQPLVYVVVLNWNNYEATKKCLESLGRATYPNLKVILVDNGSSDGSGRRLKAEFADIQVIPNDENLGFARGCNVGISAALKDAECAYVLLLNNDAVVIPEFLEKAVETAEQNPRIGLVGGKILMSSESKRISYAGGYVDRLRAGCVVRGSRKIDLGQYDNAGETCFVIGALMLIKRAVLENIGLLPEEYFFGLEDLDYSLNVRRVGYKLFYVPEFVAYHRGDGSHWNLDPKFIYIGFRSRLIFQQKYLPKLAFPIWKTLFILYAKYIEKYRALRAWRKQVDRSGNHQGKLISTDDFNFAFDHAIEDHGKNVLCEEVLSRFSEALRDSKRLLGRK